MIDIKEIEKIKLKKQIEMYKNNINIIKQQQLWAILNNNPKPLNYSSKYINNILPKEYNISENITNSINNKKYFTDNTLKKFIAFIFILLLTLLIIQ